MIRFKLLVRLARLIGLRTWIDEDGDLLVQRKPVPDYDKERS